MTLMLMTSRLDGAHGRIAAGARRGEVLGDLTTFLDALLAKPSTTEARL